MSTILEIISNKKLQNKKKLEKVLSEAIRKAFDQTHDKVQAESLILIAYKNNLPCVDGMLSDFNASDFLPFKQY